MCTAVQLHGLKSKSKILFLVVKFKSAEVISQTTYKEGRPPPHIFVAESRDSNYNKIDQSVFFMFLGFLETDLGRY